MENDVRQDCNKVIKVYGKFLVVMYLMYMAYLVMVVKGSAILNWFETKIDWLKSKFRRKPDEDSGWMDV